MRATFAQQRAAYDALGLEPEQFNNTASVLMEPHGVTVVRYARDAEGSRYVDPTTGRVAIATTVIDFVKETP